jgi:hypothetical protein
VDVDEAGRHDLAGGRNLLASRGGGQIADTADKVTRDRYVTAAPRRA